MKFCDLILFAGCLGAASTSSALTLGNSQGNVFLGSGVDLVFQVQPDTGQTADSSCMSAEVWLGDVRLGNSQVQLQTISDTAVRVRTMQPVDEPLVNIRIAAGCAGTISRSYTFFADPPLSMAASPKPIDLSRIQVNSLPAPSSALPQPSANPAPITARPTKRPVKARAVSANANISPSAAIQAPSAASQTSATEMPSVAPTPSSTVAPEARDRHTSASEEAAALTPPRLQLQPLAELLSSPAETAAMAETESEALLRSSAIDPNTQLLLEANARRLAQFEQQLLELQTKLSSNHTEITSLRTQLAQAQEAGLPVWVNVMLGLLALALATIAWLLQRLKQERAQAEARWADTVMAAQELPEATGMETQMPFAVSPERSDASTTTVATDFQDTQSSTLSSITPAVPAAFAASSLSPTQKTPDMAWLQDTPDAFAQATPAPSSNTPVAAPAQSAHTLATVLTAQALFDIQEQAEFYASVGEHDQAIQLLEEHIAQHENSSPLAYLELLQLLYRLSRTEAFENVREKFQRHFNVQVPGFLRFGRKGHDLWSSHPEVLSNIEALWPTDDVLPLLRSLIIAPTPGAASDVIPRFDLAAFDDLLMLYNVAQTTPAATRGALAGRMRTAPTEVPLPEVDSDDRASTPQMEFMPDDVFFKSSFSSSASKSDLISEAAPLSLQTASLEALSAAPAQAPLSTSASGNDSPFQKTTHFAGNEVLVDGLTLDWDASDAPMPSQPATPAPRADLPLNDSLFSDSLLNDPLLSGTTLSEINLEEFMLDERDLPSGTTTPSSGLPR